MPHDVAITCPVLLWAAGIVPVLHQLLHPRQVCCPPSPRPAPAPCCRLTCSSWCSYVMVNLFVAVLLDSFAFVSNVQAAVLIAIPCYLLTPTPQVCKAAPHTMPCRMQPSPSSTWHTSRRSGACTGSHRMSHAPQPLWDLDRQRLTADTFPLAPASELVQHL